MFRNTFIGIMAGLVFATSLWLYDTIWQDGKKKDFYTNKRRSIEAQFEEIAMVEDSYEGLEERFRNKLDEFDDLKTTIPDRNNFITIFDQIRRIAAKYKVELTSLNPILDDSFPAIKENLKLTTKHIERIPVQIACSGKYIDIGKFIEEVTDLRYKVNVGRVTISTNTDYGGKINCDLVLFAYRFIETN